jgi:CsoR family transcriptional regulator, copper-sensing transcriptional repressor
VPKKSLKKSCPSCSAPVQESEPRTSTAVDPEQQQSNLMRLRRIEGQVRGLQKMVEEKRYCPDILVQVSAVQEALQALAKELMRNHLKQCATRAIRAGGTEADRTCDELLDLIYKYSR